MSYQQAFNDRLVSTPKVCNSDLIQGEIIFLLHSPVMAHDNSADPCLTYANAAALNLWRRSWKEMIGMPSRLTAPENERENRKSALKQATQKDAIQNYQGIRIDSHGQHFMIKNARIWTIWDDKGNSYGQAATFDNWKKL